MTNERVGSLAGLAAMLFASAVAWAGQAASRPLVDGGRNSLASRLEPGLGFDLTLVGVSPAALRKRLRLQAGDIGTVAEDPVTGLRILQRRQWQRDPGVMLIEHRLVTARPQGVQVRSVAVADLRFRPARRPTTRRAARGAAPRLHVLGRDFLLHRHSVSAAAPVRIGPDRALPMLVLADERGAGGIVLAAAASEGWLLRATLDPRGSMHVRFEIGPADQAVAIEPGGSLALPPIVLAAYTGPWSSGAAKLRGFWASRPADRRWQAVGDHIAALCRQATAKASPSRTRALLGQANYFVPASMLPCRIPAPPRKLTGPQLQTALRSYLSGAWKEDLMPRGLPAPVARALEAAASLRAEISDLLEDLYLRLSPPVSGPGQWDVRQFHSRRHDAGVVLVFRQQSPLPRQLIRLRGLKGDALYRIWDSSTAQARPCQGKQLMTQGLRVTLPKNGSRVLRYEIIRPGDLRR